MKLKYAYAFAAVAALFAGFMAYLRFTSQEGAPSGTSTVLATGTMGEPGTARLVIAYAGDLMGSLDPCG